MSLNQFSGAYTSPRWQVDVLGHEESAKESKNEKATQTSVNMTKHYANQASTEKRRKDVGNERLHSYMFRVNTPCGSEGW